MESYIVIGVIQKPFGIKGELKVKPLTDFIAERFKVGTKLILRLNGKEETVTVSGYREHGQALLIRFEEYQSLTDVELYHGAELLLLATERHELPHDTYYFSDLEGCQVYHEDVLLGVVTEVMDLPAQPVLRIQTETGTILIPFVEAFVEKVDVAQQRIDVKWLEGLW